MGNKIVKNHSQSVIESRKTHSDRIEILFPKGEREKIKAYAQSVGLSLNEFIRQAIKEKMQGE